MRALPVELVVKGRRALAIGAGVEIVAKVERLVAAGASVTVVAERPDAAIEAFATSIHLVRRPFEEGDLDGQFVVYLAPGDDALAARLFAWALREGRLLCTIDRPETCTFTSVASFEASGLNVALSSSGASPALVKRLREDLAALLSDARLGRFVDELRRAREKLPRGERARRMAAAVQGFAVAAELRFPAWFEQGKTPPSVDTG